MATKVIVSKYETDNPADYIGNPGEVWVDNCGSSLHLGDGCTPGGGIAIKGSALHSVAVGSCAGASGQSWVGVAVGRAAGAVCQGPAAVAIGHLAGGMNQGEGAVAVGSQAGNCGQGVYAVAIGNYAGYACQAPNSIVINATGSEVGSAAASTTVIKPVRVVSGGSAPSGFHATYYNPATGELIVVTP